MKRMTLVFTMLVALFWPGGPASAQISSGDADAMAILQAMATYVGSLETIRLSFDSDIEVITPKLEKIQFTNSGEVLLHRPDKLYARRLGGYADVALYYDGTTVTIHGKHLNGYAQYDAPGDIDGLIESLRQGHGVALPGADLLLSHSYDHLAADVLEAKHIGRGVIDERECEHLAFRNFDTDWQLWVETGSRPVPRKLVITTKTLNSAPQYTVRIKEWETGDVPAPAAFIFTPPPTAELLDPNALIELDELPPDTIPGGTK
jgi:hypothetical protein